jgi:RNA recognition motif-containing protein
MKIYVGNLSRDTTEDTLRQAWAAFGQVESVAIITDKYSGQSRGFGFVEMPDRAQAQKAIADMNGKQLDGSTLNVNEAKPRESRDSGGGYGDRRPGHGGGHAGGRRPY